MSFNPVRAAQTHATRRPQPDAHAGRKHSDIMASRLVARPVVGPRTNTKYGHAELAFESEGFVVRREVLYPGGSIGYGVNETCDRTVLVERGLVFMFLESREDGSVQTLRLTPGHMIAAPRGLKHGWATSGADGAELVVIENPGYDKSWQQLQDGSETVRAAAEPRPAPERHALRDRSRDAAMKANIADGEQVKARRKARTDGGPRQAPNSFAAVGVNPRPSGPPRDE